MNYKNPNVYVEYNGERLTMAEMARKYGVNEKTFSVRILRGWDVERALFAPVLKTTRKKSLSPANDLDNKKAICIMQKIAYGDKALSEREAAWIIKNLGKYVEGDCLS